MVDEKANATNAMEQAQASAAGAQTASAEKIFTQAEVDALITARLARAMKGMPDRDELAAFRSWKSSQQTEVDKLSAAERERDEARDEAEQYKRQLYLLSKGIPADDLDYYAFKIGKLVTADRDFEAAAEGYLKDHPISPARDSAPPETESKEQTAAAGKDGSDQNTQPGTPGGVRFTTRLGSDEGPKTKEAIMAIKDRKTRRAMIAENFDLFKN